MLYPLKIHWIDPIKYEHLRETCKPVKIEHMVPILLKYMEIHTLTQKVYQHLLNMCRRMCFLKALSGE